MNAPRLHHYVPRFHLRRFTDQSGLLWAWSREEDRVFAVRPEQVAGENRFYFLDEVAGLGKDPQTMEVQFADLESEVAIITSQWLTWLRECAPEDQIPVPGQNRDLVSLFVALQFLRTLDAREILVALAERNEGREFTEVQRRYLHTSLLWDRGTVHKISKRISDATWVFARNPTAVPFVTSDNPVAFRSGDNSMWLKAGVLGSGVYVVYPLAPDIVMYCYPVEGPWGGLSSFDRMLSPVDFTEDMVRSENSGQVFMASRFVFSARNEFGAEREFARDMCLLVRASPAS